MNLQPKNKLETGFSLASMTDIIFLLLIFFMLTSAIVTPTALPIDLPKTTTAINVNPKVSITVTAKLEYFVNNTPVKLEDMEKLLNQELTKTGERKVIINIDKKVPVEYLIKVTTIANNLKAKVAIATQIEPEKF